MPRLVVALFGEGLTWEESIPAQVGALTGIQSANLAVHGFGKDQAFLRLQVELPRFERPVAVISLFMPVLFGRNLDRERPYLSAGLVWQSPVHQWRVQSLFRLMVPYHRSATIDDGLDVPSLLMQVDPAWRLPWDRHPDARAAHAIATAIASRLKSETPLRLGAS